MEVMLRIRSASTHTRRNLPTKNKLRTIFIYFRFQGREGQNTVISREIVKMSCTKREILLSDSQQCSWVLDLFDEERFSSIFISSSMISNAQKSLHSDLTGHKFSFVFLVFGPMFKTKNKKPLRRLGLRQPCPGCRCSPVTRSGVPETFF